MVGKWKVLLPQEIDQGGMDLLLQNPDIEVVGPFTSKEEAQEYIEDVDGVIVRSVFQVDADFLDKAKKLKVISRVGVGLDNIDIVYARQKGIKVISVRGENALSAAEHTIALVLALAKSLTWFDKQVRKGNWESRHSGNAIEIAGKTIGLIGFGNIVKQVAEFSLSLGMKVLFYDPFVEETPINGVRKIENLQELLKASDFVSLHIPLTEATRGLIGERELHCMQSTAFLINVARGAIVNKEALYKALKKGWIAGAGLDVFSEEPPAPDDPLLELENVILAPHIAGLTRECAQRTAIKAVENLITALKEFENHL